MRRFLVLTTLFALGSLFVLTPQAQALPSQEIETIYFADDSSQEEVGGSIRFCNGFLFNYGVTSQYRAKFKGESCNSSAPEYCVSCYSNSGSGWTRISCSQAQFNTFNTPTCSGEPTGP